MAYTATDLEPNAMYEPWFSTNVDPGHSIQIAGWLKKKNMRICRNPMREFSKSYFIGSQANYDEDERTFYWGNILEITDEYVSIERMRGKGPVRINLRRFVELNFEY